MLCSLLFFVDKNDKIRYSIIVEKRKGDVGMSPSQNKKSKKKEYGNDEIEVLKGADRVRKRPGVIFGSNGLDGCEHSAFEILSNSIDEAREGHGDKIILTKYLDSSIEIEDFGRGIPVDYNTAEQRFNWDLVFCEMYAGGKYSNGDGNYEYSLGLNGLGLCATQYASEYMDAQIKRDGSVFTLHFEKGNIVGDMTKEPTRFKVTGTKIRWKPDLDVFTEIDIPTSWFMETMKRQSVVNPGLTLTLRVETTVGMEEYNYYYENGIEDYLRELADGKAFTPIQLWSTQRVGRDREDMADYKVKLNVALCFSKTEQITEYYHNSSYLEHGGSPEKAVQSAMVSIIDSFIKQNSKYTKNESKIKFADVDDCMMLISSSFSTSTSYENQTKKSITNRFVQEAMTDFLKHQMEVYFLENPDDANRICDQVLLNKRSREKAEKTRIDLKKTLGSGMDMQNRVQKFVDCRSRDPKEREIFIVEGDSALGACKQARDSEFQAIIPVRGKILNCLKADYDKIFKSEIILDVFKVLGCGVEVKSKSNKDLSNFDLSGLRFEKIIICTDADVDGFQIRTLILTMLYRLAPTLIENEYVYIAESPLYEIACSDKTYFAYDEKEKAEVLEHIGDTKYSIHRSKGLGENEPEMMWATTMCPKTRRLIKVSPDDVVKTEEMFDILLGDNLQGRKDFIAQFGGMYLDELDIS